MHFRNITAIWLLVIGLLIYIILIGSILSLLLKDYHMIRYIISFILGGLYGIFAVKYMVKLNE